MSKEEKKAIEKMEMLLRVAKQYCNDELKEKEDIDFDIYGLIKYLETALNYIKELEKEKQQVLDDYQDLGKDLANNFVSKETLRKIKANTDTYRDFTEEVLKLL